MPITSHEDREHAQQVVEHFVERFEPSYRLLAYHVALPLVLTPELVNYLRNRFLRGIVPWLAESDLLLSDLCRAVGYEQYVMDTAVRAYLVSEMQADSNFGLARMQEVARLLIHYIRHRARTSPYLNSYELRVQQWAAMVYLDEHRKLAVREIAGEFRSNLQLSNVNDMARQVDKASLAALSQLTLDLSPQLETYEELIVYARNVCLILADSVSENLDFIRSSSSEKTFYQGLEVEGLTLPSLDEVLTRIRSRAKSEDFPSSEPESFGTTIKPLLRMSFEELRKKVHKALRLWHRRGTSEEFLEFLFLTQQARNNLEVGSTSTESRLATNSVLIDAIDELEKEDRELAEVLRMRFMENQTLSIAANRLNYSKATINQKQRRAIEKLTQIIKNRETEARENYVKLLEAKIPPPTYTSLFGLTDTRKQIVEKLLTNDAPWLLVITGINGIGKTALADSVTREVIRYMRFDDILWFRVDKPEISQRKDPDPELTYSNFVSELASKMLPSISEQLSPEEQEVQLRIVLKQRPLLIVIDNLETEFDSAHLIVRLSGFSNPSKFLLTSRTQPVQRHNVLACLLGELSAQDAYKLMRRHAQDTGVATVASADDAELEAIYNVVGGNPLALKLVVSLLDVLPWPNVLQNLIHGQSGRIGEMYRYIYSEMWQVLSPHAQNLLKVMPLVADSGALPDYLLILSDLSEQVFWPALQELLKNSLLEVRGTPFEKRYGIHRLTETFLRSAILEYPTTHDLAGVTSQFIDAIQAGVVYWKNRVGSMVPLDSEAIRKLDTERQNLYQSIKYGLKLEQQALFDVIGLVIDFFPVIEQRGYWTEWILILQKSIEQCPEENLLLKFRLFMQLGQLYRLTRQLMEAIKSHNTAHIIGRQLGNRQAIADASLSLSTDYLRSREYEKSERYGLEALEEFIGTRASAAKIAATLNTLGLVARYRGDLVKAQTQLSESVRLWRTTDQSLDLSRALINLADVLRAMQQYDKAVEYYQEAVRLQEASASVFDKLVTQINLGIVYYSQQRWHEAEAAFREADSVYLHKSHNAYYQAILSNNLGNVLLKQGRFSEAEAYLSRAIELWKRVNDNVSLANSLGTLAEVLVSQGNVFKASHFYEEAQILLSEYSDDAWAVKLLEKFAAQRQELENIGTSRGRSYTAALSNVLGAEPILPDNTLD